MYILSFCGCVTDKVSCTYYKDDMHVYMSVYTCASKIKSHARTAHTHTHTVQVPRRGERYATAIVERET